MLKHIDFIVTDLISYTISFLLANHITFGNVFLFDRPTNYLNVLLWQIVFYIFEVFLLNIYKNVLKRPNFYEIIDSIKLAIINFVVTNIIFYVLKIGNLFSRKTLILSYALYIMISAAFKVLLKKYLIHRINKNIFDYSKKILVVASAKEMDSIIYNINNAELKIYKIEGICFIGKYNKNKYREYKICNIEDIYKFSINNGINSIFITENCTQKQQNDISKLIKNGIDVNFYTKSILRISCESTLMNKIGIYETVCFNTFSFSDMQIIYMYLKRLLDILISIIGIVLLIPLLFIIRLIFILSGDYDSIIYKQTRVGKDGKEFSLYKIRTMCVNADEVLKELLRIKEYKEEWDKNRKLNKDPRISKVGNILRKTSIDEIPQFINIFKGDMSLIGPRPLVPGELEDMNGLKLYEKVRPGITGWWACNGRSEISYEDRLDLEYYYVKNISLKLDMLCAFKTFYIVLTKKGAK